MRYYANTWPQNDFEHALGQISLCMTWLDWDDRTISHVWRETRIPEQIPVLLVIWGGQGYDQIRVVQNCFNKPFEYVPELIDEPDILYDEDGGYIVNYTDPNDHYTNETVLLSDQLNELGPEDRMLFFLEPHQEQQVFEMWGECLPKIAEENERRRIDAALRDARH